MSERFTEQAGHAVVLSARESEQRKHHHVGTEHRLLGLLLTRDVFWACFRAFGASPPIAALPFAYLLGRLGALIPVPDDVPTAAPAVAAP